MDGWCLEIVNSKVFPPSLIARAKATIVEAPSRWYIPSTTASSSFCIVNTPASSDGSGGDAGSLFVCSICLLFATFLCPDSLILSAASAVLQMPKQSQPPELLVGQAECKKRATSAGLKLFNVPIQLLKKEVDPMTQCLSRASLGDLDLSGASEFALDSIRVKQHGKLCMGMPSGTRGLIMTVKPARCTVHVSRLEGMQFVSYNVGSVDESSSEVIGVYSSSFEIQKVILEIHGVPESGGAASHTMFIQSLLLMLPPETAGNAALQQPKQALSSSSVYTLSSTPPSAAALPAKPVSAASVAPAPTSGSATVPSEQDVKRLAAPLLAQQQAEAEAIRLSLIDQHERQLEAMTSKLALVSKANDDKQNDASKGCVICMDAPPAIFFLPCGHLVVCEGCHNKGLTACPLCRAKITAAHKAFSV